MANDSTASAPAILRIRRVFEAPRALVFRHWTEAEHLAAWFAPDGFETTSCEVDARAGGRWQVTFASNGGEVHHEWGEYLEVAPPDRLVFTLTQRREGGEGAPETTVRVSFHPMDGGTEMVFEQSGYRSAAVRDANASGWEECFGKLERRLS